MRTKFTRGQLNLKTLQTLYPNHVFSGPTYG